MFVYWNQYPHQWALKTVLLGTIIDIEEMWPIKLLIDHFHYWDEVQHFFYVKLNKTAVYYIPILKAPFLAFYWSNAYHVRKPKLGCFPRNCARKKQYVIDLRMTIKITCVIAWRRNLWTTLAARFFWHFYFRISNIHKQ